MAIQGLRRFRKHQWGIQSSFSSNTAATVALPLRGAITVDPQLQFPDVDTGSLDPTLAPFAGAAAYAASLGGEVGSGRAPSSCAAQSPKRIETCPSWPRFAVRLLTV